MEKEHAERELIDLKNDLSCKNIELARLDRAQPFGGRLQLRNIKILLRLPLPIVVRLNSLT